MCVNWFYLWAGLFAFCYPLTAFLVRVLQPSPSFLPSWMFAAFLTSWWTYQAWSCRDRVVGAGAVESAGRRRQRRSRILNSAYLLAGVFAVGAGARYWVGRPSWTEITGYALACGLSIPISDWLIEKSALNW